MGLQRHDWCDECERTHRYTSVDGRVWVPEHTGNAKKSKGKSVNDMPGCVAIIAIIAVAWVAIVWMGKKDTVPSNHCPTCTCEER